MVIPAPLGWVLLPFMLLAAIIAQLVVKVFRLKDTKDRTSEEVARIIRNFINDEGGRYAWDDFESVPIADPALDKIRIEAALAGPPNPDFRRLAELAAEAEALASLT